MNRIGFQWRSLCAAGVLLTLALVVSGCGSSLSSRILPSPFAGQWVGTWTNSSAGENGTMGITIGTGGDLTGTIENETLQASGIVSGKVQPNGEANMSLMYPGKLYAASGTVAKNSSGDLVGTLQTSLNDAPAGAINIELQKQ